MHDINFEQYKVFYFVAKNLSFSLAAKELFISQSAVSQSIKHLETRIGVSLFIRQSKKISLTEEGQILYESVKVAFSHISNGELSIIEHNDSLKKEIKIAASDTISKYFLLPYIETFHALHPEIKIKISNKPSNECLEMLKSSDVDIAVITHIDKFADNSIKTTKIKQVNDVFIAGPKYSYLKGKELSLEELVNYPILALEKSSSSRKNFESLLKTHNLDIVPEIEMQSMGLLKDFTRIGLGFSYITDLAISKTSDLFVLNIKEPLPSNFISAATLKRQKLSRYTTKFLDLILNIS